MHCLTPLVLLALQQQISPADPRMLVPPPELDGHPRSSFAGEKVIYGDSYEHHVESANFTVQWSGNDATEAYAQGLLDSLEEGWSGLVEDQGWPGPVSSDRYLLWVILDPTLSGSGFTTTYSTDEFPDGYPVSYVTPYYADSDYPGFSRSVAVHEFSHMLQYGVRDWRSSSNESWYWEASAEWMADQGAPELDTYGLSTYWYANNTTVAYNSTDNYHQYGMLLLPRYLEDTQGPEVVRTSWLENDGREWGDAIGDAAGLAIEAIIPEMAGAYAAGAMTESELFYTPAYFASEGEDDASETLGTLYANVDTPDGQRFVVEGPGTVRYAAGGSWTAEPTGDRFIAAITRTGGGTITWGFEEDAGGTDDSDDSDVGDDSAGDTAAQADDDTGETKAGACGCAAARGPARGSEGAALLAIAGIAALARRKAAGR